jgi:hypothetical protein
LNKATDWLALNAHLRFRSDHLAALQQRMRQRRREGTYQPQPEEIDDRGKCVLCLGTGRVIVPNPKALHKGEWGTCAVLCNCALGRWWEAQQRCWLEQRKKDNIPRQRNLNDYEREVPDWKERLREHDDLLKQHVRASGYTREIDLALGEIKRRVQQRRDGEQK